MTLPLDGMVRNAAQGQMASVAAANKASQSAEAEAGALTSNRIGQPVSATVVQLSALGQVKSSFVAVENAAQGLSMTGKSATAEDVTKAVQNFAASYNNAAKAVNAALQQGSADSSVKLASVDLGRLVSTGNNAADLKRAGIKVGQDGSLSVDTAALQNALQAGPSAIEGVLAQIGAAAEQLSGNVLGTRALGTPGARARNPAARPSASSAAKQAAAEAGSVTADAAGTSTPAFPEVSR